MRIYFVGRIWVQVQNTIQERLSFSAYYQYLERYRTSNPRVWFEFVRMTPELFDELVARLTPIIQRRDTNMRTAITVGMNLVQIFVFSL